MRSSKSRRKNSHRLRYTVILVLVIFIGTYTGLILTRPLKPIAPKVLASPLSASGKLTIAWPNAEQSSIGVLGDGSISSDGTQSPTPTASIAKLVTALAVLKKYPLSLGQQGPTITITDADVADYNNDLAENGSVIKVTTGEQITEYQALQAMLLPSANNMADTLANWAFGSSASYVTYSNQMVGNLGMNATTIADPSGYSPNTVSTSNDIVKLGEFSLYNPVIAQIVDQANALLPVAGLVRNVDEFVGQYNLIGIKTGNTDQAGGCFLSAAKYDLGNGNSITIIGAVMKAPTLQAALNDTIPMLQSVKNLLQLKSVASGTPVSSYKAPWASIVTSVTKDSLSVAYLPGAPISYNNASTSLIPPASVGTITGKVTFGVGDDKSSTDVILGQNIAKPTIVWRLTHPEYFF